MDKYSPNAADPVSSVPVDSSETLLVDKQLERNAIRKLDFTIVPVMILFYLLSFLERVNIGNARVAGLQKDLHLTDNQYQICLTILFIPYILTELPATLILRKLGPRVMMPTLLAVWGIIATLQGFINSFQGLLAARFFLGLVEGPVTPSILLYLSGFYTRQELSTRMAYFFATSGLTAAFAGLLAAAIEDMNGIGGKAGWRWILILEGLLSFVVGVVGYFLIPSDLRDSGILSEAEKDLLERRLEQDRPSISDELSLEPVIQALLSPHVIIMFVVGFLLGTLVFGLALFMGSIINELGFTPTRSQLLGAGPFGAGFFAAVTASYVSDKYMNRGIPSAIGATISAVGFAIFLSARDKFVVYGSLYLTVPGIYALLPVMFSWIANNSEPHYRRASCIALVVMGVNMGGILSTWSFPTKDAPRFTKTTIMNLVFCVVMALGFLANSFILSRMNASKQRRRAEILAPYGDDDTDGKVQGGGLIAWKELGDKHPDFRYTI